MEITRAKISYVQETVPTTLKDFKNWTFTSGSYTGDDFKVFAKLYKKHIGQLIKKYDLKLISFNIGHYFLSGFITDPKSIGKYVYFSISDVRFFVGEWYNQILIRTAKHNKDYTGGANCFTSLDNFAENAVRLLEV